MAVRESDHSRGSQWKLVSGRSLSFFVVEMKKDDVVIRSGKFGKKEEAERACERCAGKPVKVVRVVKKEIRTSPPKLFDLTALQKEANRIFGYTARQNLDYLQSLYEKKLVTYPRTDSRYLTNEMLSSAANLLSIVRSMTDMGDKVPNVRRLIDSSKVSDHYAIIITPEVLRCDMNQIPDSERKILEMVMVRMAEASAAEAVTVRTDVEMECGGIAFHTTLEDEVQSGYREYTERFRGRYGKAESTKQVNSSMREQFCKDGAVIPGTGRFRSGRIRRSRR